MEVNAYNIALFTAVLAGCQFLIKEGYSYLKNLVLKNKAEKRAKRDDFQKAKEVLEILEDLNEKESYYKDRENKRMLDNNMAVLLNQRKTSDIINDIIISTEVERFVLFHTHNGNGQPNYFKPYKVSYLQYNAIDPSHINKYQNIEVDSEYTKMLIEIQENQNHKLGIEVEKMEESLLKSIYKKEKIKYAEVYFLCATSTGIIYTSLATSKDVTEFKENNHKIELAISKIKSIFTEETSRVFIDAIMREENETRLKEIFLKKEELKESVKALEEDE
jgi:hypothetical protein